MLMHHIKANWHFGMMILKKANGEQEEVALFYKLSKIFFEDYKNKRIQKNEYDVRPLSYASPKGYHWKKDGSFKTNQSGDRIRIEL